MFGTGFLHFKLQTQHSNSVKIVYSTPKIDFYSKNMKLPVQKQKLITDDFRAVYSYFVFSRVRCRFFAHLH